MHKLIISLILSLCTFANSELSQVTIGMGQYSTSDNFSLYHLDAIFDSNRRYLFWPYNDASSKAYDYGVKFGHSRGSVDSSSFVSNRITPFISRKFNDNFYITLGVLYHSADRTISTKKSSHGLVSPNIEIQHIFNDKVYSKLSYNKDYIFSRKLQPGGVDKLIKAHFIEFSTTITKKNSYRWNSKISEVIYDDGNSEFSLDTEYKFHFGRDWGWFWIGPGFSFINNKKVISNYWSPNQFIDLSIRLELNHEFHKNKYLGLNLSKGRQQEKGFVWGNSTYINAYLQFGNRNHSHVVLSYERIDSSRENSKWNSNHFKIEFKESF